MGTSPCHTKNSLNFWFQLQKVCFNPQMDFEACTFYVEKRNLQTLLLGPCIALKKCHHK
jgi:hypothetical protein